MILGADGLQFGLNNHVTGRVASVATDLLAKSLDGSRDPVLLFSTAQSRADPSAYLTTFVRHDENDRAREQKFHAAKEKKEAEDGYAEYWSKRAAAEGREYDEAYVAEQEAIKKKRSEVEHEE